MMRNVTLIIFLAFVAPSHSKELSVHYADLDSTALGKPGHLAITSRTCSKTPVPPCAFLDSTFAVPALTKPGIQPQFHGEAAPVAGTNRREQHALHVLSR